MKMGVRLSNSPAVGPLDPFLRQGVTLFSIYLFWNYCLLHNSLFKYMFLHLTKKIKYIYIYFKKTKSDTKTKTKQFRKISIKTRFKKAVKLTKFIFVGNVGELWWICGIRPSHPPQRSEVTVQLEGLSQPTRGPLNTKIPFAKVQILEINFDFFHL